MVVDKRLAKPGTMIVRAGSHQEAIEMRYQDFARLEHPRVEDFAVPATSMARFVELDDEDTNPGGTIQRRYRRVQGAGVSARPGTSCLPCEALDQLRATSALLELS